MKVFIVEKRRVIRLINIVLAVFVVLVLSINTAVNTVMANKLNDPITSIYNMENEIALTVNLTDETDIDLLISKAEGANVTAFVSYEYSSLFPQEVKKLSSKGFRIGMLENSLKGKTRNEINDTLASRIEELAVKTGKNAELVRFDGNTYDNNSVKAVFAVDLFPIQWSTDDTAGIYSAGDIILVSNINSIDAFIKRLKNEGYNLSGVSDMILRENYSIDLSGRQTKK